MKTRASIVQVVQHLTPGGIETMVLDLVRRPPNDLPTYIVSLEGSKQDAIANWNKLSPLTDRLFFLNKQPGWSVRTLSDLFRLLRKLAPQIVHTHHIGPMLYGGLSARIAGVPVLVHTEHDAWHLEDRTRRNLVRTLHTLLHPTVVADSLVVGQSFRNKTGRAVDHVILNGIDTSQFQPGDKRQARQKLSLPENCEIVGIAGRLEYVKGQDVAVRAFAKLEDRSIILAIAGNGSERHSLVNLASSLGVQDRVIFLGHLDDMPTFYQALDLLCLPSRHEGMPLSILEAQACGLPVVATDVGGVSEAVCPSTGRLVAPGLPAALAESINVSLKSIQGDPRVFAQRAGGLDRMVKQYAELMA